LLDEFAPGKKFAEAYWVIRYIIENRDIVSKTISVLREDILFA